MAATLHSICHQARSGILVELDQAAKDLLLTPALGNGVPRAVDALGQGLLAYEALVKASHSSSTESWALSDLPFEEREVYERVKHTVAALERLHGFQVAP